MKILMVLFLMTTTTLTIAQKFHLEISGGMLASISTSVYSYNFLPTNHVIRKSPIFSGSLGYTIKKANVSVSLSGAYGYLTNSWYIGEHVYFSLGDPLIIDSKYSFYQVGLHVSKRTSFKKSYYTDYKIGLGYNTLLTNNDASLPNQFSISNNPDGLKYQYELFSVGNNPTNLSGTFAMSIGKKLGKNSDFSLNVGVNVGFVPLRIKGALGGYVGKKIINEVGAIFSISNTTYLYMMPSLRYYF